MNEKESSSDSQKILESAWRGQAVWSETANHLKHNLSKWRTVAAIAAVIGAVFETAAATLFPAEGIWSWICVFIAAVGTALLIVAPYVLRTKASPETCKRVGSRTLRLRGLKRDDLQVSGGRSAIQCHLAPGGPHRSAPIYKREGAGSEHSCSLNRSSTQRASARAYARGIRREQGERSDREILSPKRTRESPSCRETP